MLKDRDKIFAKNKETLKDWQAHDKEEWCRDFAQFFDSQEAVDKFMDDMDDVVKSSVFSNRWGYFNRPTQERTEYEGSNILDADGAVNKEKFNEFLFHVCRAMKCISKDREIEKFPLRASYSDSYNDSLMRDARENFERAFPPSGSQGTRKAGISFMISHFLGNENSRGVIEMLTPYIREFYKEKPEEGKAFFDRLVNYQIDATKEVRSQRRDANKLSNDMGKLFAGESSDLGKGAKNKQMSE